MCRRKSRVKSRVGARQRCAGGKAGYRVRSRGMTRKGRWGDREQCQGKGYIWMAWKRQAEVGRG